MPRKSTAPVSTVTPATATSSDTVVKLPLNDTVVKDNPNSFAEKLREAILKYDNEHMNMMNAQSQITPQSTQSNQPAVLVTQQRTGQTQNNHHHNQQQQQQQMLPAKKPLEPIKLMPVPKSTSSVSNSSTSSPSISASPDNTYSKKVRKLNVYLKYMCI